MATLDAFAGHVELDQVLSDFIRRIEKPEVFLSSSSQHSEAARNAAKAFYDFAATSVEKEVASRLPFKELSVGGFDAEQIWGQIEPFGQLVSKRTKRLIKRMGKEPKLLTETAEQEIDSLLRDDGEDAEEGSQGSEQSEDEIESDMEDSDVVEDDVDTRKSAAKSERDLLATEDEFLRLDDMEKFVEEAETKEQGQNDDEGGAMGEFDHQSDSELNEMMFAGGEEDEVTMRDQDSGEEEEEEEEEEKEGDPILKKRGDEIMFDDFFGRKQPRQVKKARVMPPPPQSQDEIQEEREMRESAPKAAVAPPPRPNAPFHPEALSDKTKQELEAKTLAEQIGRLEESAIAEKPWPLRGEVKAGDRPMNSALEVDLDFDTTVRPPPVPTEEATQSLEDMIKKRIADHQFDDVVRVVPPPIEKKRKLIELDDSKAKEGLGELYESEYVRAKTGGGVVDKDERLRQEAKLLYRQVCAALDSLTHFHFAPKPVLEDMEVKVAVPAIAMEEALPMGVSEAALQAPEEVYSSKAKGGEIQGEGEKSREDRKRLRQQIKRKVKNKDKEQELQRINKALSEGGEASVLGRKSLSKSVGKKKKGQKVVDNGGSVDYGNSRAVFAKLQDEREQGEAGKLKKRKSVDVSTKSAHIKL
ncbi:hypothetical protein BSKO_03642 [Bryopsis sp. KO-2023]|nr:hypothetical protein BSKO_03642 [Bryopsis sp. KO-2023]